MENEFRDDETFGAYLLVDADGRVARVGEDYADALAYATGADVSLRILYATLAVADYETVATVVKRGGR